MSEVWEQMNSPLLGQYGRSVLSGHFNSLEEKKLTFGAEGFGLSRSVQIDVSKLAGVRLFRRVKVDAEHESSDLSE